MSDLKPCPFCGGEARHYAPGPTDHHIECMSCSADVSGYMEEAEAVEAWNTRACDACEHDAVPMTDEAMAEHGWVRERTCRPEEVYLDSHSDLTATVCSNCRVAIDDLEECYYCPNCGRRVEHD